MWLLEPPYLQVIAAVTAVTLFAATFHFAIGMLIWLILDHKENPNNENDL